MRYLIDPQERHIFLEKGYTTFEGFLTPEELTLINQTISSARISTYQEGRNLWKRFAPIRNLALSRQKASIISGLTNTYPLTIAFDQLCFATPHPLSPGITLDGYSSVQWTVGCMVYCLQSGKVTCYSAEAPLPLDTLFGGAPQLLIAYASANPLYRQMPTDPHTNELKREGYAFGDHLSIESHPQIASLRT